MCSADNMSMTRLDRVDQAVSHYPWIGDNCLTFIGLVLV